MSLSLNRDARSVLTHLWRMAPECCVCRKQVERMEESRISLNDNSITIVFGCHGKWDAVNLGSPNPISHEPFRDLIRAWPKRVFLKNWARYSLVKPKREGRLE